MKTITKINEMKEYSRKIREEGKSIGFVPTMGYLHEGHLSLLRAAQNECDVSIISVFVNPTQFSAGEDLDKYPRDIERDLSLADREGADVMFTPEAQDMYPEGYVTNVKVDNALTRGLCGKSRLGHFEGVATVVAKLFSIVFPCKSYFGQKDAQQAVVIKRMTKDLNLPVDVRVLPIVREPDGLAMSSRNTYLSSEERGEALNLYRSLDRAKEMVLKGERSPLSIKLEMKKIMEQGKNTRIDYIEMVDADTLSSLSEVKDNTLIAVAAFVGKTRLIDNIIIKK